RPASTPENRREQTSAPPSKPRASCFQFQSGKRGEPRELQPWLHPGEPGRPRTESRWWPATLLAGGEYLAGNESSCGSTSSLSREGVQERTSYTRFRERRP